MTKEATPGMFDKEPLRDTEIIAECERLLKRINKVSARNRYVYCSHPDPPGLHSHQTCRIQDMNGLPIGEGRWYAPHWIKLYLTFAAEVIGA